MGTDRGLNRLHNGVVDRTYTVAQGLPSNQVRSLFEDRNGVLWAGTSAGAARFAGGRFTRATSTAVVSMGEGGDGKVYLATAAGVTVWKDGNSTELLQNGAPLRGVDTFFRDRDGSLWMGMLGTGIRLIKDGKISSYFIRDGLFDGEIYGIIADDQDRLWMACSKGIFSVPRGDLLRFAAGELKKFPAPLTAPPMRCGSSNANPACSPPPCYP